MSSNNNIQQDYQPEAFQGINLEKLQNVARKSIVWIILIFIITNLAAYLIVRYTKPVYESASEIKLDLKSNASELGIGFVENQNLNLISSEIELIKSKLFFNQVIKALDLQVSYYTIGQILTDEKYKNSPFEVEIFLKNNDALDRKYYVELISNNKLLFSNEENFSDAREFRYGEIIETPEADFKISLTRDFDRDNEFQNFFIINSNDALLDYIEDNLSVEPINLNANTIRISFTDNNRFKAYDLVNTIDTIYLSYSQQEKLQENKQKIQYLNYQLGQIENLLENYETYFEEFTLKYRTSNLNEDLKQTLLTINELDSQEYVLNRNLIAASQIRKNIKADEFNTIVSGQELPVTVQKRIEEINQAVDDLNRMMLFYKKTTGAYAVKVKALEEAKFNLEKQLEDYAGSINENLQEISRRKEKLEASFAQIPEQTTEYNKNQRFFKLYEEFYLSLMQTKAQFEIAQAGTTPDFKILAPASLPVNPISPNTLIIHGIGLVSGLIFGFLLIAFRYIISNKIISINELERLTNNAILGSLPSFGFNKFPKLIIEDNPRSAISESLRTIRTNIEFMLNGKENKLLSVTSTVGGEGKTFISVNLAGIIAYSTRKVVIVDLDLRKPKVHEAFSEENAAKGVSTLLIRKHTVEECIRPTQVQHLDYIPAGPTPPNPSELLLNDEFNNLLDKLKEKYDLVILDTPPVGIVTDGILVMRKVDLPIYVFRANYSRKEFLKTFNRIQKVNNIKNLAVILNAVPNSMSKHYGNGYYEKQRNTGAFNKIKMIFSNT